MLEHAPGRKALPGLRKSCTIRVNSAPAGLRDPLRGVYRVCFCMAAGSSFEEYGECRVPEAYIFEAGTIQVVGTDAGLVTYTKAGAAFELIVPLSVFNLGNRRLVWRVLQSCQKHFG